MAVPASSDEIDPFSPASLANVPVPPVFRLRPASGREIRAYEYRLAAEGLRNYRSQDFRDEILKALPALYDPATAAASKVRLESYWALSDQSADIDPVEKEAVEEFVQRAVQAWRPLSVMAAQAKRYNDESARIAAAMFIMGWSGLDVPYSREDGAVPLATIDEVEFALAGIETKARADKVEGVLETGTAFAQLVVACVTRLFLTKDEEKNSQSPPSSTPGPNGSTKTPSKQTAGRSSKASASSESTKA